MAAPTPREDIMKFAKLAPLALAAALCWSGSALAQTKVSVGVTAFF